MTTNQDTNPRDPAAPSFLPNTGGPNNFPVSGPPVGSGVPGDASGPDVFSNDSGPISAPEDRQARDQDADTPAVGPDGDEYHPERSYVSSSGGLGGGSATGTTTTRTTAGLPDPTRLAPNAGATQDPVSAEQWSGIGTATSGEALGPADMGLPQVASTSKSGAGAASAAQDEQAAFLGADERGATPNTLTNGAENDQGDVR